MAELGKSSFEQLMLGHCCHHGGTMYLHPKGWEEERKSKACLWRMFQFVQTHKSGWERLECKVNGYLYLLTGINLEQYTTLFIDRLRFEKLILSFAPPPPVLFNLLVANSICDVINAMEDVIFSIKRNRERKMIFHSCTD